MPRDSALGSSVSMAMAVRPSAVAGMPSTPMVRAMTLALYLAARSITGSSRAGSAEAEFSRAGFLHTLSPASMAATLVVSRLSGVSVTAWTVSTIQGMISAPRFFCGPMFRSRMPAPALTCLSARDWMNLASRFSMASFTRGEMMWMFSPMISIFASPFRSRTARQSYWSGWRRRGPAARAEPWRRSPAGPRTPDCRPAAPPWACRPRRTAPPGGPAGSCPPGSVCVPRWRPAAPGVRSPVTRFTIR